MSSTVLSADHLLASCKSLLYLNPQYTFKSRLVLLFLLASFLNFVYIPNNLFCKTYYLLVIDLISIFKMTFMATHML